MRDKFSTYHPAVCFAFFLGALILAMCLMHPAYLACSVFFSSIYCQTVRRNAGFAGRMLLLFLAVAQENIHV